jgi:hypothetical protein
MKTVTLTISHLAVFRMITYVDNMNILNFLPYCKFLVLVHTYFDAYALDTSKS